MARIRTKVIFERLQGKFIPPQIVRVAAHINTADLDEATLINNVKKYALHSGVIKAFGAQRYFMNARGALLTANDVYDPAVNYRDFEIGVVFANHKNKVDSEIYRVSIDLVNFEKQKIKHL